jgi:hypothetical protein
MNFDPRQNDPQYQSPLAGDSEQTSQFGMGSQADVPLQNQRAQGTAPGTGTIDPNIITPGADVFGNDGKRVGTVQEVYDDSFLVQKGIFFVHDYFIPLSVVTQVTDDRIDLGLSSDDARNEDWASRPGLTAVGRGVQADGATDGQRGGLNTQNDVNPSMVDTPSAGGEESMNPNQSAGAIMMNQAPNSQMGIPIEAGLNPAGTTPQQYDADQYDRTMTAGQGIDNGDIDATQLTPADHVQDVPQAGTAGSPGDNANNGGTVPETIGNAGKGAVPGQGTSGQAYSSGSMNPGGLVPENLSGNQGAQQNMGEQQGRLPGRGTEGASLAGQHSDATQTYVAGQGPAYGSMPSADTQLQQQMPAENSAGRTGAADMTQRATERGMQGTNGPSPDNLSGAPEEPRDIDQWDPSQQGITTP